MRLVLALGLASGCGFSAPGGTGIGDSGVIDTGAVDAPDPDAPAADASIDAAPDAPPGVACFGSAFGRVCLPSTPSGMTAINTPTMIDTDSPSTCAVTAAGTGCRAAIDAERWMTEHGLS